MTISWPPIPLLWPSWSIVRLVLTMLGHLKGQCEKWFISKYYKYGTYTACAYAAISHSSPFQYLNNCDTVPLIIEVPVYQRSLACC